MHTGSTSGSTDVVWVWLQLFLVLGTLNRRTYRRGLNGASLEDVKHDMSDFKSYRRWTLRGQRASAEAITETLANLRLQPTTAGAILSRRG